MTNNSPSSKLSVSVVIPAYRAAATICRAIDSVLAQTCPPSEILVIDDESPDDLASVLAGYGDRVRLIRQSNGGAAAARNRGIQMAHSDVVAFLDADDCWLPEKLEQCVRVLEECPDVGLVASRYILQDADGEAVRTAGPEVSWCNRPQRASGAALLDFARNISTPTVVVRRHLLVENQFDVTLATAEDRDLWLRLLSTTTAWFVDSPLCIVHLRPDSLSHANIGLDCGCMLRVIDRYREVLGTAAARREQSYVHYKWAVGLSGGWPAIRQLARAAWLWPLPYARSRTRCRWARPRTLVSIARRSWSFS
jgi:glycosyltransferase involved in cell wall biosynthesis